MEVIEHVDPPRLPALEHAVFGHARPGTVVVTTPNVEYNVRFEALPAGAIRHRRPPLRVDPGRVRRLGDARSPTAYGYAVDFCRSATDDPEVGPPTQLAVFSPGEGSATDGRTAAFRSCAWWCWSASPARASRPSPAAHFRPTEVISVDFCRGLVADDENDQAATPRRVRGAALHRGQAAGGRPADRGRRDQRAAARRAGAGRAGPGARRAAGGDRARRAGAGVPGAQRSTRRTGTSGRR